MTRPSTFDSVKRTVQELLRVAERMTAGEVARGAGVSKQTALTHLRSLAAEGVVRQVGRGRSAAYEAAALGDRWSFPLAGLEEHVVLETVRRESKALAKVAPGSNASSIFDFVLQEMVNNAIDHSRGTTVEVGLSARGGELVFEIIDDGVGALANLKQQRQLASELEAIQDLSKGKVTTAPAAHTGQGIFFSARSVDRFVLESGTTRWTVDTEHDDVAVGEIARRQGTRVACTLAVDTPRQLKQVFDTYSDDDYRFSKTQTWVRLFETGFHFLSRSEARRLCADLTRFEEVALDFKGVTEVGQSFCDELFRVWARANPRVKLVPRNMVPAVEFMVRRALATP